MGSLNPTPGVWRNRSMTSPAPIDPVRDPAQRLIAATAAAFHPEDDEARPLPLTLGGALLEAESAQAVASDALEAVLGRIETIEAVEARPDHPLTREVLDLPAPVRDAALEAIGKGRTWKKAAPGIHLLPLPIGGEADTNLIRVQPGYGPPVHHHGGDEYALILTGAYHDGHALYRAGELHIAPAGLVHRPVAQPGEVCYVLGATYGSGLRFHGLLGLLQKLTRR